MHRSILPLAAVSFAALAAAASPAWAVDKTFVPVAGGWAVAANWSPAGVPLPADRAIIPLGRTATLSATTSIDALVINGLLIIQDSVVLFLQCTANVSWIDGTGEVRTPPNVAGPAFGTGRIEVTNAQTGMLVQQSIKLGNFWLNYVNANANTVNNAKMRLNNGITVIINGSLNILVGNLELGQNPPGGATTLDVRGDVNIAGISIIDFKANNCVCICGGNWTQLGTKFKDGTNTTLIFNKAGDQTIAVDNPNIGDIDYDNLILANTGVPRTVTYNNNPSLVNSLLVGQNLLVGRDVTFNVNDGVSPGANGGIGNGTAAWSFRIESGARVVFKGNYNNSARLLFRDTSDTGPSSNGLLRLEGTITDDGSELGSAFDPGIGTVEYAGQSVAQTVWTRINATTPISYYNLVIDNVGGVAATQEAGALLDVNANFTIRNAASIFTAAAGNMMVALDFIANGAFNAGTFTTTLDATGILGGTSPSLVFNNLFVSALATDVRTVARSFGAAATFQVTRGTLTTNGIAAPITMSAFSGLSVGDGIAGDGVLEMLGPATLAVQQGMLFQVNALDGRFVARSTAAGTPTVTRVAGNTLRFTATVNGRVDITRMNFSFGDANGLNITATAVIQNLRRIRFMNVNGAAGSAHLTVAPAGLNHDAPGCYFDTLAAGTFNVRATGAGSLLRFEDRGAAPPNGGGGGPGAGELGDADADPNDDGIATAPAGGPVVQWLYTINIDLTGAIQGFPMPAFDWNLGNTYSTYALMRDASGTADTIFVCDPRGDFTNGNTDAVTGYSFTLPGADIVGPLFWDTEAGTHVVYFGTRDGRVFKLIDDTAAKQLKALPIGSPWTTGTGQPSPFTDASLSVVTSPLTSDGTNLYFGGQGPGGFGVYKVVIATKSFAPFQGPISTAGVEVSTAPSWWDTLTGRVLYLASGSPNGRIYRISTGSWSIDALLPAAAGCVAFTNPMVSITDSLVYLYVGELNGRMHAVNAASTPANFLTQRPGFPFSDGSSAAIRGGAVIDFFTSRVFYGDASGNIYTVGATLPPFALGTGYFRLATGGGPIESMPLFEEGILYASNKSGKVYCIDANNGAGQTLLRTFSLGTFALGDVSRDGMTTGLIFVGTAGGRMYAISPVPDPTAPR